MRTLKSLTLAIVMMVVTVGITSCGNGIPKGNDKEVTSIILNSVKNKKAGIVFYKELLLQTNDKIYVRRNLFDHLSNAGVLVGYNNDVIGDYITDYEGGCNNYIATHSGDQDKLDRFRKQMVELGPLVKPLLAEYNKMMMEGSDAFKLEQITTVQVDETSKVALYRAKLITPFEIKEIEYTAQYDTEGNVIVRM